jgi:hypothetical protein
MVNHFHAHLQRCAENVKSVEFRAELCVRFKLQKFRNINAKRCLSVYLPGRKK